MSTPRGWCRGPIDFFDVVDKRIGLARLHAGWGVVYTGHEWMAKGRRSEADMNDEDDFIVVIDGCWCECELTALFIHTSGL